MTLLEYKNTLLTFSETVDYPTIKDYEGVWIQIENEKPEALITIKKLGETKLKSTILYTRAFSWGPSSQSFSYKNHYITLDKHYNFIDDRHIIEHKGILKPDGIVSWTWPGGEMGFGTRTWRRPDASDYIGNWIAEKEETAISLFCEQFNVKQLLCHFGLNTEVLGNQLYDVDDGTLRLIDDERKVSGGTVIGKLQGNGNINWFSDDIYYLTWERRGKFFAF